MTPTLGRGPLSTDPPAEANYRIDGPQHRVLLTPFPRRVRAEFNGATILDTTDGVLLHESNLLPVLYVPEHDVATDVLRPTDHHTHCPFKGDASYWSIHVGDRVAENAVWSYPDPIGSAPWLKGLLAFYSDRLDRWFDEAEEVFGHLRDPYHRVDVRQGSRRVRVIVGDLVLAESATPLVLSETGLPNRYYLAPTDVNMDVLAPSDTTSVCAYKGQANYWHVTGDAPVADAAWSYPEPVAGVDRIASHIAFGDDAHIELH
jgi:uncharacterized protein (DUF427 family)